LKFAVLILLLFLPHSSKADYFSYSPLAIPVKINLKDGISHTGYLCIMGRVFSALGRNVSDLQDPLPEDYSKYLKQKGMSPVEPNPKKIYSRWCHYLNFRLAHPDQRPQPRHKPRELKHLIPPCVFPVTNESFEKDAVIILVEKFDSVLFPSRRPAVEEANLVELSMSKIQSFESAPALKRIDLGDVPLRLGKTGLKDLNTQPWDYLSGAKDSFRFEWLIYEEGISKQQLKNSLLEFNSWNLDTISWRVSAPIFGIRRPEYPEASSWNDCDSRCLREKRIYYFESHDDVD
jgi:hypothetical protein